MARETRSTRRVRAKADAGKPRTPLIDASDEPTSPESIESTYDDILEVIEGLPSDGDILVSRLPATGGKRESLGELDIASFSINFVASRWGAGKYFLQFRAPNAEYGGRKTIVTAKVLVIGEGHLAIKPLTPTTPTATAAPSSVQQAMDAGLLAMIGSMAKMVMTVSERPATTPDSGLKDVLLQMARDRAEDNKTMMAFVEKITTAMSSSRRGDSDPYELAVKIAQLQGGRSGVADAKEMIGMALEMAEMVGGKGKDEPEDMMSMAFKGFMGMLDKMQFAGARVPDGLPPGQHIGEIPLATSPAAPDAPAPTTPTPTPTPANEADMNTAMLGYLKGFVEQALKFAEAKRNPRVYAHVMADALESYPMEVRRKATLMLAEVEGTGDESPFTAEAKLTKFFPDMAVHPDWFEQFFEELRLRLGIIKADEEEDDDGDEPEPHEAFDSTTPPPAGGKA